MTVQILDLFERVFECPTSGPHDLGPPPHNTPLPDGAAGFPTQQSLRGKALRRAMGQMSPTSARAREGSTPIGEVHGPPNSPDPQMQRSTVREPEPHNLKARVHAHQARRPVFDDGAHTCPDPWPNWVSSSSIRISISGQHHSSRGSKAFMYHVLESELHAAPSAPQFFLFRFHPHYLTPSRARICWERAR